MCTKWTRITLGLLILIAAPLAQADDGRAAHQPAERGKSADKPSPADPSTKLLPATASDTAKANAFGVKGAAQKAAAQPADPAGDKPAAPADPATKTLPASASDSARANAFGQQGARSKAAHQAARAAAAQEAQKAADQGAAAPGARPNASATTHASATGASHGFDRATAGATNGQGATHSHR